MRLKIRDATRRDLPKIMQIERRAFDQPWSLDSFMREFALPFSRTLIAVFNTEKGESIAGYLCRWLVVDECHILNVAVDPSIRRNGIGARLMSDAIKEAKARSATVVSLEVRRSNLPARGLYRKFEFQERRLRRNYYGPGEDAIVMELLLNQ
ncbi:MAG TPA: ribosomal protein S18-alanine N-acetyltransferase [Candidatus Binataceae bacterium]|nr:ribosomal protein S18-alanine N-acetyltransferase [Candidatus Binataceae bacterium]